MTKYPSSWRYLRPIAYKFLVDRDGELCQHCHKRPVKVINDPPSQCARLDVDHIDENKENNPITGENWQLLCHKCNCKKITNRTPRGPKFSSHLRLKLSKEKQIENEEGGLKVYHMTMAKNLQAEPMFDSFVDDIVKKRKEVKVRLLLDAAANDFKNKTGNTISQQALSRYLDKRTNPLNGDLQEFTDDEGDTAIKVRV